MVLAATAAFAADAPAPSSDVDPHVYTNADLERMFGPPTPSTGMPTSTEETAATQAFIERFLERHYGQLRDDKDRDLLRGLTATPEPAQEPRYRLLFPPWTGPLFPAPVFGKPIEHRIGDRSLWRQNFHGPEAGVGPQPRGGSHGRPTTKPDPKTPSKADAKPER